MWVTYTKIRLSLFFCYHILMPSVFNLFSTIKTQSTQSKGVKQSAISITGSLIASGFAAISLMLLSRALQPTSFGQFSTAFALTLILVRLNDLGLSVATSKLIPNATNESRSALSSYILRYRLALSGLILVLGIIISQFLPNFLLQDNSSLILISFIVCFATAFFEHFQFILQADHRFKLAAVLNASQGLLKLLFSLPAVILILQGTLSPATLITPIFLIYMLSPVIPVILLWLIKPGFLPVNLKLPTTLDKTQQKRLKQQLFSLIKHAALGIVAAGIIENVDILFVQGFLDDYQAGLLGGVTRIALLFYIVGYSLGNVLNPRVAKYKQYSDLVTFWKKAWLILAGCVLGFVLLMFAVEPLIFFTIGQEYLQAANSLRVLLGAGFITIALMPFIAFFYSFEQSWYFSLSGVLQLLIVILGNIWLVPIMGIEGSAWVRLASRGVLLILTIFLVRHQLGKMKTAQREQII